MRLHCNICGKIVSSEVPENITVRAWLECPECIEDSYKFKTRIDNTKEE